jgi:hypothetical protein
MWGIGIGRKIDVRKWCPFDTGMMTAVEFCECKTSNYWERLVWNSKDVNRLSFQSIKFMNLILQYKEWSRSATISIDIQFPSDQHPIDPFENSL